MASPLWEVAVAMHDAVEALKLAEWGGHVVGPRGGITGAAVCPVCKGIGPNPKGSRRFAKEMHGHRHNCALDAALKDFR